MGILSNFSSKASRLTGREGWKTHARSAFCPLINSAAGGSFNIGLVRRDESCQISEVMRAPFVKASQALPEQKSLLRRGETMGPMTLQAYVGEEIRRCTTSLVFCFGKPGKVTGPIFRFGKG